MAPRTLAAAADWLEDNYRHDGFLLWVDTWDPHEPFDPPPFDHARYAEPGYDGYGIIYPQYGRSTYLSEAELNDVRARYAGEVTMVDRWVGHLLDKVHALGLDENTMIVHITDHGYLMGEHDIVGKAGDLLGNLYEPTCHVGMFIRHPQGLAAGQRIPALVQPPDVMPTILDFLGLPIPSTVQGASLMPLLRGEAAQVHEHALSGRFIYAPVAGVTDTSFEFDGMAGSRSEICSRTLSTERWSYICAPYDMPSELYDLAADPGQQHNVIEQHPDVAAAMFEALIRFLEAKGTPETGIAPFRRSKTARGEHPAARPDTGMGDMIVHVMRDNHGKWLATPDEAEARVFLTPAFQDQRIETMTLAELHRRDPRAMVRARAQFYWAEDLMRATPQGMNNELVAFKQK